MNNMMKKAFLLVATAFAAQFATAGLLYWSLSDATSTLDSAAEDAGITLSTDEDEASYYVSLYMSSSEDGTYAQMANYIGSTSGATTYYIPDNAFESTLYAIFDDSVTSLTGYYFYLELYDTSATLVATSEAAAVTSEMISAYTTSGSFLQPTIADVGSDLTYTAVPEPTGGLLVLMGAALLGLKRKRLA